MRGVSEDTMDSATVTFSTADGEHPIPVCDIVYIESRKNYFEVHCTNTLPFRCRGTLSKAGQLLNPYPFYRVHAAYLINMENVSQVCGDRSIRMCDGSLIYVGQKRYSAFRKAYLRYTSSKEEPEQTAKPGTKKLGMLLLVITVLLCGLFAVIAYATDLFVPKPPEAPSETLPVTELPVETSGTLPATELTIETRPVTKSVEDELVDEFIARVEAKRQWCLEMIAEKEALTAEREALLNGRSEDALTEDGKTRLAEIDDKLLEIWFHEPLDPDRYELETYVLNWLREDIPYYTCLLEKFENIPDDRVAVRYRNIIEVSQKCLEMYDNGADIREIIGYRLTQIR